MIFSFDTLGVHFDTFMVWGFLMALCINVFFYFVEARQEKSIIITSLFTFLSYFISNHLLDLNSVGGNYYTNWIVYDVILIALIFFGHRLLSFNFHKTSYYIFVGLCINILLNVIIHVDIIVLENRDERWFWSLYSIGVNIVDYVMIITLIVGRDWLGLVRLGRFIRNKAIAKKERFIEKQKEKRLSQAMLQA